MLELLSDDDSYSTMDIKSFLAGEMEHDNKETYLGEGSGIHNSKDTFVARSLKKLAGKVLTWKNRPIYDQLWTVIEDDLLPMVQQRVPQLEQRPTWFVNAPSQYDFVTADGQCDGSVAAYYKGARIDWITTCKFFSKQLGFGNMRIDG